MSLCQEVDLKIPRPDMLPGGGVLYSHATSRIWIDQGPTVPLQGGGTDPLHPHRLETATLWSSELCVWIFDFTTLLANPEIEKHHRIR